MRNHGLLLVLAVLLVVGFLGHAALEGDDVTGLTTFAPNTTILSAEVNANFEEVRTSVNDNDQRITALEGAVNQQRLTFPARALARSDTFGPPNDLRGFLWGAGSMTPRATILIRKPVDYAGGDVIMDIVCQKTAIGGGDVDFTVHPSSVNDGDSLTMGSAVTTLARSITGLSNTAMFMQPVRLPAAALANDFWHILFYRGAATDTHASDIVLCSVSLNYSAN